MKDLLHRAAGEAESRTYEERFVRYHAGLVHSWTGTATMLCGILVPLFVILDRYAMPGELFSRSAKYRIIVTALVFLQWIVIKLTRPSRWSVIHGWVFTLLVGGLITWMTVDLGGFDSSYYAGLNLVMLASLLVPWTRAHAIANTLSIILTYVVAGAIWGGPFHVKSLLNNLFFMGSTAVIAIVTAAGKFELIRREFRSWVDLQDANESLERSRGELKAARDALWGEMEVAKRIQTSLLPENRRVGPYEVVARMLPAAEVGGDYYDIIQAGEDRNWIAIGDVSGHGVESGLVMMMTQTSIMSLVHENPRLSPAEVFNAVNGVLLENISRLQAARYMTLNVVRLREEGLTVAGKHQDVLVWRQASGRVEAIANEGCWLGVVEDTRGHVNDLAISMSEGDLALFFTDGATEAMNDRSEMFGEDRLATALERVAQLPLDDALDRLFAEIAHFRSVQDDDVTMMLVRRAARRVHAHGDPPAAATSAA